MTTKFYEEDIKMKKIKIKEIACLILSFICCLLVCVGCENVLRKDPLEYTEEDIFIRNNFLRGTYTREYMEFTTDKYGSTTQTTKVITESCLEKNVGDDREILAFYEEIYLKDGFYFTVTSAVNADPIPTQTVKLNHGMNVYYLTIFREKVYKTPEVIRQYVVIIYKGEKDNQNE